MHLLNCKYDFYLNAVEYVFMHSDVCVHLAISECEEEEHLFEYYFYFLLGMARAEISREQSKRRRQVRYIVDHDIFGCTR